MCLQDLTAMDHRLFGFVTIKEGAGPGTSLGILFQRNRIILWRGVRLPDAQSALLANS